MKTIKQLFLCLMVILSEGVWGQNQWYFGEGAGLDFTNSSATNPPTALPANTNQMMAGEGSTMAYDSNGNLILYSDGRDVWLKNSISSNNEILITDTEEKKLKSTTSTTQSSILLPIDCNKYVIVTVKTWDIDGNVNHIAKNSLYYSIINISDRSNPTITIPQKMLNTDHDDIIFSEKLAAIKIPGSINDFWLVAHDYLDTYMSGNANTFYVFRINSGIENELPSVNTYTLGNNNKGGFENSIGQMKFSNNGKILATIDRNKLSLHKFNMDNGRIEIFENEFLREQGGSYGINAYLGYGIEFSSNDDAVYFTNLYDNVYRVNLINPNWPITTRLNIPNKISNTDTTTVGIYPYGALQMGKDGFLYMARSGTGTQIVKSIVRIDISDPTYPSTIVNCSSDMSSNNSTGRVYLGLPTIVRNTIGCNPISCNTPTVNVSQQSDNPQSGANNLKETIKNKGKQLLGQVLGGGNAAATKTTLPNSNCLQPGNYIANIGNVSSNTTFTLTKNGATISTGSVSVNNPTISLQNLTTGTYTLSVSTGTKTNCTQTETIVICGSTNDPCENSVVWVKNSRLDSGSGGASKAKKIDQCLPSEANMAVIRGIASDTFVTYTLVNTGNNTPVLNGNVTMNSNPAVETTIPFSYLAPGTYELEIMVNEQVCQTYPFTVCGTPNNSCPETAVFKVVEQVAGRPQPLNSECYEPNRNYEILITGFTAQSPRIFYTLTKDGQTIANNLPLTNSRIPLQNAQSGTYNILLKWGEGCTASHNVVICGTPPSETCKVECCLPSSLKLKETYIKDDIMTSVFYPETSRAIGGTRINYEPTQSLINAIDSHVLEMQSNLENLQCSNATNARFQISYKLYKYNGNANIGNALLLENAFNNPTTRNDFQHLETITNYSSAFNFNTVFSGSFKAIIEIELKWTGINNTDKCTTKIIGGMGLFIGNNALIIPNESIRKLKKYYLKSKFDSFINSTKLK